MAIGKSSIKGLKLGYGFSWYRYGPYSQELVADAYEVLHSARDTYQRKTQSLAFCHSCRKRFDEFKKICRDVLNKPEQLELIASVDFARATWYPDVDEQTFISRFISERKKYLYGGGKLDKQMMQKALEIVKKLRSSVN